MRVPGLLVLGGLLATVVGMSRSGVLAQSAQPTRWMRPIVSGSKSGDGKW